MVTVVRVVLKSDCTGMDATADITFGGYSSIPYVMLD